MPFINCLFTVNSLPMHHIRLLAMFSFLPLFACKLVVSKAPIAPPKGFDWQGHRGARGLMPENTVPAFLAALAYPEVSTLELDLAVSKDNQLIVSHEPWFNPIICMTPNGDTIHRNEGEKYLIYRMTEEEIKRFDCGMLSNPRFPQQQKIASYKPSLREVVEAVKAHDPERFKTLRWNIEIKSQADWDRTRHPAIEVYSTLVVKTLRELGIDRNCNIQSFDLRPLQIINRMAPEIPLAYLIENMQSFEANVKALGFLPAVYSPYYLRVSKELIKKCHKSNVKVIPWTVNDVGSMRQLIRMGVDGIITDYPNLIQLVNTPK